MVKRYTKALRTAVSLSAIITLTACAGINERVANIGQPPAMSKIESPYQQAGYQPVSLPMPVQEAMNTNANALWQPGRQTFFKDQRAHKVGDILTILITIADKANIKNKTERTREGDESAGLSRLFGVEKIADKLIDGDTSDLVGMGSESTSTGDGKIERQETIDLKLAAMVTQVLPNGNFVIRGSQEVRVNYELRQLTIDGVIRPEDILNNNSISYEKIAEARISYGGQGQITEIQQPRYGQQFIDAVSPF
ncbi:MAG: flagellar basal body L-ring protein FlgH [Alphaproteobacteria bacterium]|nr:flagellar basal body L-ring protein FlgH [Alphaproteobacteria bacterium]